MIELGPGGIRCQHLGLMNQRGGQTEPVPQRESQRPAQDHQLTRLQGFLFTEWEDVQAWNCQQVPYAQGLQTVTDPFARYLGEVGSGNGSNS